MDGTKLYPPAEGFVQSGHPLPQELAEALAGAQSLGEY